MEKWLDSSYDSEGPLYWVTLSLCLHPQTRWKETRLGHLRRLIVLAHARHINPAGTPKLAGADTTPKDYSVYKSVLVFFGLIDNIYCQYFKVRKI